MNRFVRFLCVWVVIFLIGFLSLEIGANIYIHFLDEEKFGHYASTKQIIKRLQENKGHFKITIHPIVGYIPTPNYRKGMNKHNIYGFRGDELGEKKEGEVWIVCVGESTTYDSDIEDWEKAYPAQLERYLNEKGVKVKVINAGVDGWTSFEILLDFMFRISKFPVDIIIYYGGLNDIGQTRFVYPVKSKLLERDIFSARQGISGALNYPFWEESSFLRIILVKYGIAIPHGDLFLLHYSPENLIKEFIIQLSKNTYPSGIFKKISPEEILSLNSPIWFENNISNLVLLAGSKEVKPVLVKYMYNKSSQSNVFFTFHPDAEEIFKKVLIGGIDEMNTVLGNVSKKLNIPLFDLPTVFPVESPDLFKDMVHNSEEGAKVKAELIGDFLINNQIVSKR